MTTKSNPPPPADAKLLALANGMLMEKIADLEARLAEAENLLSRCGSPTREDPLGLRYEIVQKAEATIAAQAEELRVLREKAANDEVAPERTKGRVCEDLEINQGKLVFDGFLDHQDELEIWSDWKSVDLNTFISRHQAKSIISHLQQVFSL